MRFARWSVIVALSLASCNGCEEEETPPTTDTPTGPSGERHIIAGIPVGTIEGVVRLAEGEEAPSYADSPFDAPTAGQVPATCSPPRGADRHPLAMDAARGLASVGVVATGDPDHWLPPGDPVTHELHIRDCRLSPITVTATRGDIVRVVNEHDYPFMPDIGLGMLQAALPSDPLENTLDRAGPRTVECRFAAPCGRALVFTFGSPVHAVTTEGGHFRIENAPADQDITLSAIHPTLVAGTATVRVTEGGTAHVDIVVHAAEIPDAPPPTTTVDRTTAPDYDPLHDMTPERLRQLRDEATRRELAAQGIDAGIAPLELSPPATP